jgi:hypothetical protein
MQNRDLFHGTTGDNILAILRKGAIWPDLDGKIYFSEWRFDSVLMHGADRKRKAAYAVKIRVTIPSTATPQKTSTPGVTDTLVITTPVPLRCDVLELYIREARSRTVKKIAGEAAIKEYLSASE